MPDQIPHRRLVELGTGVYTVSEVCRILPGMTPRKVHYWLDTRLLSAPVRHGSRGFPTLLSYRQVLEIRTVQHLRDDLDFSLRRVRGAFSWILERLFARQGLSFAKGVGGELLARYGRQQMVIPGGQGVLEGTIPELNRQIEQTRVDWRNQAFVVSGYEYVVTDAYILAGSPTLKGTRIETALLARYTDEDTYDDPTLEQILESYPQLSADGVRDALAFEGLQQAA